MNTDIKTKKTSSWIDSIKEYHSAKGSKFSIPKKGTEEHASIMSLHTKKKINVKLPESIAPLTAPSEEPVKDASVPPKKRGRKPSAPKKMLEVDVSVAPLTTPFKPT